LLLVGAGGASYEEAAEITGCAIGTVKSRLARGRVALAALINGPDDEAIDRATAAKAKLPTAKSEARAQQSITR
jgi:RNA polymerase sigma-70 factor, ECF subfamily